MGIVAAVVLGVASPRGTTPIYPIVLVLVGTSSFSCIWTGFAVTRMRSIVRTGYLELNSAMVVRRMTLGMWSCSLVFAILGCLVGVMIARAPKPPQLWLLIVAVVLAALIVGGGGIACLIVRRVLPPRARFGG